MNKCEKHEVNMWSLTLFLSISLILSTHLCIRLSIHECEYPFTKHRLQYTQTLAFRNLIGPISIAPSPFLSFIHSRFSVIPFYIQDNI